MVVALDMDSNAGLAFLGTSEPLQDLASCSSESLHVLTIFFLKKWKQVFDFQNPHKKDRVW